jgi:hephaestin
MITADMVPDDVGTWMYHGHVSDHMEAGMMAMFRVVP